MANISAYIKFLCLGLLVSISLLSPVNVVYAQAPSLQEVLSGIRIQPGRKLFYTEKRSSFFLKNPKLSSGYLQFIEPDTLIKQVQQPEFRRFIMDTRQLRIRQADGQEQSILLSQYSQFQVLRQLYMGLLNADATLLTQGYQVQLKALREKQIQLELKPQIKDTFMSEQQASLPHIIIDLGKHSQYYHIQTIRLRGISGDAVEMTFPARADEH